MTPTFAVLLIVTYGLAGIAILLALRRIWVLSQLQHMPRFYYPGVLFSTALGLGQLMYDIVFTQSRVHEEATSLNYVLDFSIFACFIFLAVEFILELAKLISSLNVFWTRKRLIHIQLLYWALSTIVAWYIVLYNYFGWKTDANLTLVHHMLLIFVISFSAIIVISTVIVTLQWVNKYIAEHRRFVSVTEMTELCRKLIIICFTLLSLSVLVQTGGIILDASDNDQDMRLYGVLLLNMCRSLFLVTFICYQWLFETMTLLLRNSLSRPKPLTVTTRPDPPSVEEGDKSKDTLAFFSTNDPQPILD